MSDSRIKKSVLNARINLLFYLLGIAMAFFSRKVFLDRLGDDFIGLTGILTNILGFLNLAELGISSAIGYLLYEPLQKKRYGEIEELISVFGYLYRKIGYAITIVGVILSFFIPVIFNNTNFDVKIIFFAYYAFLSTSLISYFCNYKQTLLTADQRNYVVVAYYQSGLIIKTITQIFIVLYWANYYYWIFIELCYGIVYSLVLNYKIRIVYPWLKSNVENGKEQLKLHSEIFKYVRLIFYHKIKDFLLMQSDQIFVFAFVSLKMVAYYGNYLLIINKLSQLTSTVLDSVTAGVGNLVAEGNQEKINRVFWELMAIRYYAAGVIVVGLYFLLEPFVRFWLGSEYILSNFILVLFLVNIFIVQSRGAVDSFNAAYGLYADVWAVWFEGGVNVLVTVIVGYYWGIAGILLGKIFSTFLIIVLWKPYYLFNKGFCLPIRIYWKGTLKYYIAFGFSFCLAYISVLFFNVLEYNGVLGMAKIFLSGVVPFCLVYFVCFYFFTPGLKSLLYRFSVFSYKFHR